MQKILILAVSREDAEELARLLKDRYEILTAFSSQAAAELAEKITPDLVITDLAMWENAPIGSQAKQANVPVLVIVKQDVAEVSKAFSCGGADYITKPFIEQEVATRVKTQLELKRLTEVEKNFVAKLEQKNYQLKDVFEQMDSMARIDLLTNLPNKPYMLERMRDEIARAFRSQRPLTVIMADVDDLKAINDVYGYECGDYVLQKIADLMRNKRRGQDVVGRWGENLFIIMLPDTYLPDGGRVAERVRNQIENDMFIYEGKSFRITVTFGAAEFDAEWGIEGTVAQAINALQQGKNMKKNCVVVAAK